MLLLLAANASLAADPADPPEGCPAALPLSALEVSLTSAEAAWGVDEDAFRQGAASAQRTLKCVGAPLDPPLAARAHRVEGLAAYLYGDAAAATRAFAAAKAADPAYTFPVAMIPPQNPVRVAYDGAVPTRPSRVALPPAGPRTLRVDGTDTRVLPTDRPSIVQLRRGKTVDATAWVPPGGDLPAYRVRGEGLRVPMLVGTAVLAGGAGALWALGAAAREDALEPVPLTEEERGRRQDVANGLGVATISAGAAAVGTGAAAFLYARW